MASGEGDGSSSNLPTIMVVLLAILGFGVMPRSAGRPDASKPDATAAKEEGERSQDAEDSPLPKVAEFLGRNEVAAAPSRSRAHDGRADEIRKVLRRTDQEDRSGVIRPDVHTLIVTIADPEGSVESHLFDEMIDTIQRAAESQSYVLDRYEFPWKKAGSRAKSWKIRATPADLTLKPESKAEGPDATRPGSLLFRRWLKLRKSSTRVANVPIPPIPPELLVVYLVRESPIAGVNKAEMQAALDEVEIIDEVTRPGPSACPSQKVGVRMVAPCFTGSRPSLSIALSNWDRSRADRGTPCRLLDALLPAAFAEPDAWLTLRCLSRMSRGATPPRGVHLEILNGMATGLDAAELLPRSLHLSVRFRSTMLHESEVRDEVIQALAGSGEVAILVESNSGFGAVSREQAWASSQDKANLSFFSYPLHISQLRSDGAYKAGEDGGNEVFRSAERTHVPLELLKPAEDLPGSMTPKYSTMKDDLLLNQTILRIKKGGFDAVGIIATDPRDVIFLTQRLKAQMPSVRIFTNQAELVLAHPDFIAGTRGLYVGSMYPLVRPRSLARARSGQGSQPDANATDFGADYLNGLYNAIVLQIGDQIPAALGRAPEVAGEFRDQLGRDRVEFLNLKHAEGRRPAPVWISRVGYQGVYPIEVRVAGPGTPHAPQRNVLPLSEDLLKDAGETIRAERDGVGAYAGHETYLSILAISGVGLLCLAVASHIEAGEVRRRSRGGWAGREDPAPAWRWLLMRLNWPAPGGDHGAGQRGPGPAWVLLQAAGIVGLGWYAWPVLAAVASGATPDGATRGAAMAVAAVMALAVACLIVSLWSRVGLGLLPLHRWPKAVATALALAVFSAAAGRGEQVVGWLAWPALKENQRVNALIDLERAENFQNGLSPSLPCLFTLAATGFLLWNAIRRRRVIDRLLMKGHDVSTWPARLEPRRVGAGEYLEDRWVMARLRALRQDLEVALAMPLRGLRRNRDLAAGLGISLLIAPLALWTRMSQIDRDVSMPREIRFEAMACLAVLASLLVLLSGLVRLIWAWWKVLRIKRELLMLPISQAFDRLPSRVGFWFREVPQEEGGRTHLIARQARALGARANAKVVAELIRRGGAGGEGASGPSDVRAFEQAVLRIAEALPEFDTIESGPWMPLLCDWWGRKDVDAAYGATEVAAEGKGKKASTKAATGESETGPSAEAERWLKDLEELLALLWGRWLSTAIWLLRSMLHTMAWTLAGLALAVSSYPFVLQRPLLNLVILGAVGLGAVAAWMFLGLGSDELIARLMDKEPGKFRLDPKMCQVVAGSILPVLAMLTALSLDLSYSFRTLLDPILGIFH